MLTSLELQSIPDFTAVFLYNANEIEVAYQRSSVTIHAAMTHQYDLPKRNNSYSLAFDSLEHLVLRLGTLCLQLLRAIAVVIYHCRAMEAAVCSSSQYRCSQIVSGKSVLA